MPRAASPSPALAEWHVKRRPSLTVAGPRRIRTGFPVRPVLGAQTRHGITMCYNLRCPGCPIASSSIRAFASLIAARVAVGDRSAGAFARGAMEVVENCAVSTTYVRPPARAVTLNQAATEVMLALHLEDRLVGTTYLDDCVPPELAVAYARVPLPVRSTHRRRSCSQPARISSTPCTGRLRSDRRRIAGRLEEPGRRHVSRAGGMRGQESSTRSLSETMFNEVRDIARIFGVTARADKLIDT